MDRNKEFNYTDEQLAEFGEIISLNNIIMTELSRRPRNNGNTVSISQYDIHTLMIIKEHPNITSIELSKKIGRTKSTISTLIFKLYSSGYITKEINPSNRREHCLNLTELGLEICKEHRNQDIAIMKQSLERMLEYCTLEEFETFIRVTRIRNNIFINDMEDIVHTVSSLCEKHM